MYEIKYPDLRAFRLTIQQDKSTTLDRCVTWFVSMMHSYVQTTDLPSRWRSGASWLSFWLRRRTTGAEGRWGMCSAEAVHAWLDPRCSITGAGVPFFTLCALCLWSSPGPTFPDTDKSSIVRLFLHAKQRRWRYEHFVLVQLHFYFSDPNIHCSWIMVKRSPCVGVSAFVGGGGVGRRKQ